VEWRDTGGKVVKSEEAYFYAPFFIEDGEGVAAPFGLSALSESGSYALVVTATDGLLKGQTWEAEIDVGEVAAVDSGQSIGGSLLLWTPAKSSLGGVPTTDTLVDVALRLYPGEVFSPDMEAFNTGSTQWERERPTVEGSVAITAVWTREGDPDFEMVQQGMLPCDISPGQRIAFPIALQAPTAAGSYTLTLRLNCLGITYIGDPIVIPVTTSREAVLQTATP